MNKGVHFRFSATNAAAPAMRQFQQGMQRVNRTVTQNSGLQRSWNAGLNSNRRAVQQFGFQMSDFAIQIAGGQSAMLAFTQQGGQMLQFFGPAGSIAAAFVAVFGSLAIAFTKSGKALSDLFPLMGVLQDEFRGLGRALSYTKELLLDFANLIVNNLDVILISASLLAGFFIGKWVIAFIAARGVVGSLVGVLNLLKATLIRTGIGALVIALGYAIERFLRLKNVVGGFGEALKLLWEVASDIFKRLADAPMSIAYGMKAAAAAMAAFFLTRLGTMLSKFMEFTWEVAEGLNGLFGTSLEGAKLGLALTGINQTVMSLEETAANAGKEMRNAFGGPIPSLERLRELMTNGDGVDVRDWFNGVGDAAEDGAGRAADAIEKGLTPALERLKSVQETVGSAFENAITSMVDGTKSAGEAFKAMAVTIIKELYRIFVVKQITGFLTDAIGGMFGGGGSALSKGGIKSFDGGGYTGRGSRSGGLDGKGGRLAMLHPNETVIDHERGGGGSGTVVNQTFNISSESPKAVEDAVNRLMPRIAEATKSAVADGARRGGSFGKAFA